MSSYLHPIYVASKQNHDCSFVTQEHDKLCIFINCCMWNLFRFERIHFFLFLDLILDVVTSHNVIALTFTVWVTFRNKWRKGDKKKLETWKNQRRLRFLATNIRKHVRLKGRHSYLIHNMNSQLWELVQRFKNTNLWKEIRLIICIHQVCL
jgi:hypothetical protein